MSSHITMELHLGKCYTNYYVSSLDKVTLRLTVSQSVCLGVEPLLGLMSNISSCPVHVRRPL
jgi:hypothetical protein